MKPLHRRKGTNLLYTKWHDKRDVNILSTDIDPLIPPVVKERRKKKGEVEKPYCIEQYNKYMELIIQLLPLVHKWYKYLFWFIFYVFICNAFILHKEDVAVRQPGRPLVAFRCALGKQLIAGYSSHSNNRKCLQKAASLGLVNSPENAHRHFVSRREGKARKRHCVQCKKD